MKIAIICGVLVTTLVVVQCAPMTYMQALGTLMREKRQAMKGNGMNPPPKDSITYCTKDEEWPVHCASCSGSRIMAKDSLSCLACPSNCANCTENFKTDDGTSLGTTTCTVCNAGYFLTLDSQNATFCEGRASYCTGCSVQAECDTDKCTKTSGGVGTVYDATTKTCKMCASSCSACTVAGECSSTGCFPGYAYKASTKTCEACPANCAKCAYSGDVLKCETCNAL